MDKKKIIELYNRVQAVPYYCLEYREPDLLLKKNKGSCSEKHLFLGKEFEKLGVDVKYVLIRFDWNDLPIPKEIIEKKGSPVGWHLALKIKVARKWIYVDATWDPALEKAGFPITKDWNGCSDTKFAFPLKQVIELDERPPKQVERHEDRKFYDSLNDWLESQRMQGRGA